MAANLSIFAEFQDSCEHADTYPLNLLRSESWAHTLIDYQKRLESFASPGEDGQELFDDEYRSIYALDFSEASNSYELSQELSDFNKLQALVNDATKDLPNRYIFIHAGSSRDPLGCSKEQLLHILTHYQTMTPFLDHVFTFCERDEAHIRATFSSEDYLDPCDSSLELSPLGRSGLQIQHCFNLVGVEHDTKQSWPYLYRQTAAYYSFDPIEGRSVWVILKANDLIRRRIKESVDSTRRGPTMCELSTPELSFSAGLNTHILVNEWCIENWTSYIDFLEKKFMDASFLVNYTPIDGLTQQQHIQQGLSRKSTFHSRTQSRHNSGFQKQLSLATRSASWNKMVEVSRRLRATSGRKKSRGRTQPPKVVQLPQSNIMDELDLDQIFTFDQLQELHQLATHLRNAILVLGQNKRVLEEMMNRFDDLQDSEGFKKHVKLGKTSLETFSRRTRRCLRELEIQQSRLDTLEAGLDKDVALFNGILQYKNMRTGEYFAHHAKVSTDKMEELSVKTKQETVSIHAITMLTLVFLPGTFVAVRYGLPCIFNAVLWVLTRCQTFFSSNIISFEESTAMWSFGDWTTNWSALKLFGIICGPLMGLVLSAWALAYYIARHQQNAASTNGKGDEEKGK